MTNIKLQTQFFTTVTLLQFCVSKSTPCNVTSLITVQLACINTEVVNPFHPQSIRSLPINSPYPSYSPNVTQSQCHSPNIKQSQCHTVPIRHTVPMSHSPNVTQSLSVTQSQYHTVPISHTPNVTQSQCHTVPIRHTVPISHSPTVTQSQCHTVPMSHTIYPLTIHQSNPYCTL